MKSNLLKKISMIALTCAMTAALAACGNGNKETTAESTTEAGSAKETTAESASGSTVTVTDARGEVEIPADPQRIVDLSGNSDMLSILGYSVIGTANSDAYDYTKFPTYLEDILAGAKILGYSMQDTMDVEAIIGLNPDLIIISSVQESMYAQLQEIAPTVMIELKQINWEDDLTDVANIFGKQEEADKWLSDYKAKAAEVGTQLKEKYGEDTTYLAFLASAGNIYIFDAAGYGSLFYNDMGLKSPEGMPEQTDISLPVVTYEGLAAIDADYLFAVGTDADLQALYESSIWKSMEPVKAGKVIELPASPYFNEGYSAVGREAFLQEMPTLMGEVNE